MDGVGGGRRMGKEKVREREAREGQRERSTGRDHREEIKARS